VYYEVQTRLCQEERRELPKILWVKTWSDFEEMLPMRDVRLPPRSRWELCSSVLLFSCATNLLTDHIHIQQPNANKHSLRLPTPWTFGQACSYATTVSSAIGRRTAPASKSISCLAGPCVFVFVSWLRFCTHYCIWVPAASYILLYYKLQHFVSLCPIWQVRWIVKSAKRNRKEGFRNENYDNMNNDNEQSMDVYV
jgi:hypothetical protein